MRSFCATVYNMITHSGKRTVWTLHWQYREILLEMVLFCALSYHSVYFSVSYTFCNCNPHTLNISVFKYAAFIQCLNWHLRFSQWWLDRLLSSVMSCHVVWVKCSSTLMMEVASSCDVSEHFFQTEWHHIRKDINLQYMVLYLFLLYKLLNMFRATLCPSSGVDDLVVFFHVWCSAVAV